MTKPVDHERAIREGIAEAAWSRICQPGSERELPGFQESVGPNGIKTIWFNWERRSVGYAVDAAQGTLYVAEMINYYYPLGDPAGIDALLAAIDRALKEES